MKWKVAPISSFHGSTPLGEQPRRSCRYLQVTLVHTGRGQSRVAKHLNNLKIVISPCHHSVGVPHRWQTTISSGVFCASYVVNNILACATAWTQPKKYMRGERLRFEVDRLIQTHEEQTGWSIANLQPRMCQGTARAVWFTVHVLASGLGPASRRQRKEYNTNLNCSKRTAAQGAALY